MQIRMTMIIVVLVAAASGCSSVRSTMIHRGECDAEWEKVRFLHGVPITVQVPTHLKVDIIEHRHLGLTNMSVTDGTVDATSGEIVWLDEKSVDVPLRSVHTALIKTAKIFTVDPVRPAAGTLDATMTFGGANGQYFDNIDYMVDDKTIEAITGVLKQVAPKGLIGVPTSETAAEEVDKYIQRVDSVVASAFFSIDAPDLESQLSAFLEHHLNGCHTCRVVSPNVAVPVRLPPVVHEPCVNYSGLGSAGCPSCPH